MCNNILLIVQSLLFVCVSSSFFDQSQSGDLNVQVDLKGLHIIALMKSGKEEYVDYDYAYDYSEMTIKPQNRTTTQKPSTLASVSVESEMDKDKKNGTTTTLGTTTTQEQTFETTSTSLEQTVNYDNSTVNNAVSFYNVTELPVIKTTTTSSGTSSPPIRNSTAPICRKGFVLNSKGDCELKLQGTGNALLKLVKLSQKLKLRRETNSGN